MLHFHRSSSLLALGSVGGFMGGNRWNVPSNSDPLEQMRPDIFTLLAPNKYYIDEVYEWTFVRSERVVGAGVRLAGLLGVEWRGAIG